MEIFGLVFVVILAGIVATVAASIVYGIVRLWYLEDGRAKPRVAGLATWVILTPAILAYIFLIPKSEVLAPDQALAYAGASDSGFTVRRAEIIHDGGFAALFVEAEGREDAVLELARRWNAERRDYSPWGDYNGAKPEWATRNCAEGATFIRPDFDPRNMSWCRTSGRVTFFRMREGSFDG